MYGSSVLDKVGVDKPVYVSQKMREMARLLFQARKESEMRTVTIKDLLAPDKFDLVVATVRKLRGYKDYVFDKPSTARRLGHAMKIAHVVRGDALKNREYQVKRDVDDYLEFHEIEWSDKISTHALNTLSFRKHNKPEWLPITSDLIKLRKFQTSKLEENYWRLTCMTTPENWRELAELCLSRMIVFNKRRGKFK